MIRSLQLRDFKNFEDEALNLGPLTLIVGTNASGKSNIRDAFRFLHGIGRNYTLPEILGGKHGAGGQIEWAPIRGAPLEVARKNHDGFGLTLRCNAQGHIAIYDIKFDKELIGVPKFLCGRKH